MGSFRMRKLLGLHLYYLCDMSPRGLVHHPSLQTYGYTDHCGPKFIWELKAAPQPNTFPNIPAWLPFQGLSLPLPQAFLQICKDSFQVGAACPALLLLPTAPRLVGPLQPMFCSVFPFTESQNH